MIKIDEVFTVKKYAHGWELHETKPSTHEKSKTGFTTDVTYYGNLKLLATAMVDKSAGSCTYAEELMQHIKHCASFIVEKLGKV